MNEQIGKAAAKAAQWWKERLNQDYDREAFYEALRPKIEAELKKHGRCFTENDYDPSGILLEAVRDIGIDCRGCLFSGDGIFPRKHYLRITPEKLQPKEGYGNRTDEITV